MILRLKLFVFCFVLLLSQDVLSQNNTSAFPFILAKSQQVEFIEKTERPKADYVVVAEIAVELNEYTSGQIALYRLREKAKSLGAHALMNFHKTGYFDKMIMEATAIAYVDKLVVKKPIMISKKYFDIESEDNAEAIIKVDYNWEKGEYKLDFLTKESENVFQNDIKPYAEYHLLKTNNLWASIDSENKQTSKVYTKFAGEFLYKKTNFFYHETGAIKMVRIVEYPESIKEKKSISYLIYDYDKKKQKVIGRRVMKKKKEIYREEWKYENGILVGKYFYKNKAKKPFLYCELSYLNQLDLDQCVEKYQIAP